MRAWLAVTAMLAGGLTVGAAQALTIKPVVVETLSNEGVQQPHRASMYGEDYLVQVRLVVSEAAAPGSTTKGMRESTLLALSRDSLKAFEDTAADRHEALIAAREYCTHQKMPGDPETAVVVFQAAQPGDKPEMVVDGMCDLRARKDPTQ